MQETIAKESPRRIGRRLGAAGMALVAALGLGACKATGGGYVGAPLDGGVIGDYSGDANFGFNFTCEVDMAKKRTVIKGEITYHDDPSNVSLVDYPEIRLHGTVKDIVFLGLTECGDAVEELFGATRRMGRRSTVFRRQNSRAPTDRRIPT